MNHKPILSLCLLVTLKTYVLAGVLPPFSWDHVPVCAHVGKTSDDFTSEQLDFLAKHFDFITIEKAQAIRRQGNTEAGIAEAARQIKQRNPQAKVLFYWNAFLDVPQYKAHGSLPADGHLKDLQGNPGMVRKTVSTLDLSREDVRNWWTDVAAKAVTEGGCDGIFADALPQVTAPGKRKLLGEEKYQALNNGLVNMLKHAREKLGPDKMIVYNGLRGGDGVKFLPHADCAMIEHFNSFSSTGKVNMVEDIETASNTDFASQREQVLALGKLTGAPAFKDAEGVPAKGGMKAIYFEALPWQGKPTKVFARVGLPEKRTGKVHGIVLVVEMTKTVPLEKLVWFARKEPDNERQAIQHRGEDPHPARGREGG